jgi:hypothetical protein
MFLSTTNVFPMVHNFRIRPYLLRTATFKGGVLAWNDSIDWCVTNLGCSKFAARYSALETRGVIHDQLQNNVAVKKLNSRCLQPGRRLSPKILVIEIIDL